MNRTNHNENLPLSLLDLGFRPWQGWGCGRGFDFEFALAAKLHRDFYFGSRFVRSPGRRRRHRRGTHCAVPRRAAATLRGSEIATSNATRIGARWTVAASESATQIETLDLTPLATPNASLVGHVLRTC